MLQFDVNPVLQKHPRPNERRVGLGCCEQDLGFELRIIRDTLVSAAEGLPLWSELALRQYNQYGRIEP